ncbi:hypothetical protein DV736_g4743, partial [Chaetothyriales sp. CBS 134916]
MSKTTLAVVAAASAAAGVSISALFFSRPRKPSPIPTSTGPPHPSPADLSHGPPIPARVATAAAVQPAQPVHPDGILQYGFPGPVSDTLLTPSYLASFNRFTRNPNFVAEHITPQSLLMDNGSRRHSFFYEDSAIPPLFRAKLADYVRSGYDRGHQTPAADAKWSQKAMDSTFSLTNMCPQVGEGFNRDYWAHFEEFCRGLCKKYPSVRIVTGPLYLPKKDESDGKWRVSYEVIGSPPNVAVPTHFYKVIFGEESPDSPIGKVAVGAFVLPNAPIPNDKSLGDFEVPIEAIERASGLTFGQRLPEARRKQLCRDVRCEILVRQFDKSRQQGALANTGQQTAAQVGDSRKSW